VDWPSHAGRTLTGRSTGRQLGSRRIRQAALAPVNTGRFSPGRARAPVANESFVKPALSRLTSEVKLDSDRFKLKRIMLSVSLSCRRSGTFNGNMRMQKDRVPSPVERSLAWRSAFDGIGSRPEMLVLASSAFPPRRAKILRLDGRACSRCAISQGSAYLRFEGIWRS
jgi:hypothetical protein